MNKNSEKKVFSRFYLPITIYCCLFLPLITNYYLLSFAFAATKDDIGTTSAQFLKLGFGARPAAMGDAFCAVADEPSGIYWNPAGISQLKMKSISAMYSMWIDNMNYQWTSYVHPTTFGAFGVGVQHFSYGGLSELDETGWQTGNFSPNDLACTISYARQLQIIPSWRDKLQIGGNIKYISQKIKKSADAFACDIGSLYHFTALPLSVGLVVQNLGTKLKFVDEKEKLPMNIKLGCSYNFISSSPHFLISAIDVNLPNDNCINVGVGTEYNYKLSNDLMVASRAGYSSRTDAGSGLTFGAGFKMNEIQIDYAFVNYGIFENTHRFSLTARFGKEAVRREERGERIEASGERREAREVEEDKRSRKAGTSDKQEPQNAQESQFILDISSGILQNDIQPILSVDKATEKATLPPKPLVAKIKDVQKDTIVARVFFKFESSELTEETQGALNETIKILKTFSENKVIIEGNTCNFGCEKINEALALHRASSISSYLVKNGIVETRITTKGFAYKKPIVANDTAENRAQNRRVDIIMAHISPISYLCR